MDLRVLEYFLAIAREQNITGAAEVLHVTQPTLSRQMKDLEDILGKQLFIRGNRKIKLTEEGMILRKRAEEILNLVKRTEDEIRCADDISEGDIYIGTGEAQSFKLVAKAMHELQKQYPKIRFHIFSGDSTDVIEQIDKGLLDFGLIYAKVDTSKYEYIALPQYDYYGVLMRKDDPLASKEFVTPEDLKGKPFMCNRNITDGDLITTWLGQGVSEINFSATYTLLFNASLMTEVGMGYSLALDGIVHTDNTDLCYKPLKPEVKANMRIFWKKYQFLSKPAEKFLEILSDCLK